MPRPDPTPIRQTKHGDQSFEEHESWAVVRLNTTSGQTELFDSSARHQHWVHLEIAAADRRRNLHTDWIHGNLTPIIGIDMSMAQWASLVSSFGNGSGTPVTINERDGLPVPRAADDEPRLAVSAREVADAARKATEEIRQAVQAVRDAFDQRAGRRELSGLLNDLESTTKNVPSNMRFAADSLSRHSEDVGQKLRADIEAWSASAAGRELTE